MSQETRTYTILTTTGKPFTVDVARWDAFPGKAAPVAIAFYDADDEMVALVGTDKLVAVFDANSTSSGKRAAPQRKRVIQP